MWRMSSRRKGPILPQDVLTKQDENEIVSAMRGINLNSFTYILLKEAVFEEKVKNKVSSLDIVGLDCRVGVRYLIRLVYESIQNNDVAWHKFIDVLDTFGCNAELIGIRLKRGTAKHPIHHSMREKRECKDFITKLMETLVPCSHKWEEIGIALGLPHNVMEECRCRSSNAIRLYTTG